MNREIKFRGKRVDNGEWVHGFIIIESNTKSYIHWTDDDSTKWAAEVISESVNQYTGLKDKSGKEGYHKDTVKGGKKLYTIEWQTEEARFLLLPTGNNTGTWKFMDEIDHMEIIGNEPAAQESDTTNDK